MRSSLYSLQKMPRDRQRRDRHLARALGEDVRREAVVRVDDEAGCDADRVVQDPMPPAGGVGMFQIGSHDTCGSVVARTYGAGATTSMFRICSGRAVSFCAKVPKMAPGSQRAIVTSDERVAADRRGRRARAGQGQRPSGRRGSRRRGASGDPRPTNPRWSQEGGPSLIGSGCPSSLPAGGRCGPRRHLWSTSAARSDDIQRLGHLLRDGSRLRFMSGLVVQSGNSRTSARPIERPTLTRSNESAAGVSVCRWRCVSSANAAVGRTSAASPIARADRSWLNVATPFAKVRCSAASASR